MKKTGYVAPSGIWGKAVDYTRIDDEGKMWIGNGEYETQVNYCPFTGEVAPKQMKLVDVEYTRYKTEIKYTIKEFRNE